MRRVLLIAYHFPPDGLVGAARSFKFARYLPAHHWEPTVLTVPEESAELYDGTHREEVARRMRVVRVRPWPGPRQIFLMALSATGRRRDGEQGVREDVSCRFAPSHALCSRLAGAEASSGGTLPPRSGPALGGRNDPVSPSPSAAGWLRRALLSAMWLPDDKQGWFGPGVAAGMRLIRQGCADVIVSTGPPWTAHLIGLTLAQISGKPWVADFRDPWACCSLKPPAMRTRATDALENRLERWVAWRADRIVVTIPTLAERLRERYPWLRESADGAPPRVLVIPNGFDPADKPALGSRLSALASTTASASRVAERSAPALAERRAPSAESCMTFVYGGNLYGERDPIPFLTALRELIDEQPEAAEAVRAVFVGGEQEVRGRSLDAVAREMGLSEQVRTGGPLPYREYLALLASADVPLLFIDQETQIPAKLFDLLMLEKPVLAFGRTDSPAARILAETGAGVALPLEDREGIRRRLESLWEEHRAGRLCVRLDRAALRRYDVRELTAALAATLDAVYDRRRPRFARRQGDGATGSLLPPRRRP